MGSHKKKKHGNKKKKNSNDEEEPEMDDVRFRAAIHRPQFSQPTKHDNKVVLDDRFASVLTDSRFALQETDRYGRKQKSQQSDELRAFYRIEHEEKEESSDDETNEDEKPSVPQETSDEDSMVEDPAARIKYLTALSRGELSVSSSSEDESDHDENEDSDSSDDDTPHDTVHGSAGVLDPSSHDKEIPITKEDSSYLAVMDMDWKHVRAVDLFAILSSFTPAGAIQRVQVFPSNFGMERMAKEAQQGPVNVWKKNTLKSVEEDEEDASVASQDNEEAMDSNSDDDDSDSEDNSDDKHEQYLKRLAKENEEKESDFDTEKLRAYEASKLKYYFAVVEFASPEYANVAYKEVDGLELEHSSAAMDLRAIPSDEMDGVVKDRQLRDEATSIPSNYQPPDFVISALQQSSVQCTWEDGDEERQRKLTGYGTGQPGSWGATVEEDDLRAYLASDVSTSDEEEESGDDSDNGGGGKGSKMRKMLGLESSDDDDNEGSGDDKDDSSSDDDEDHDDFSKQVTFIPGKAKLEDRIRSKLEEKNEQELTPWEKYRQKRKEKRRERRQARRKLRKGIDQTAHGSGADAESIEAGFGSDDEIAGVDDDFFLESTATKSTKATIAKDKKKPKSTAEKDVKVPSTKEELELLLAGDNDEEEEKDYNMRGLRRIEKNKGKKLRGSRKRKEKELANEVSGQDFEIDTKDSRFAAVLEGTDDRFGIDRTDPNYKETEAMKAILSEQTKRRKAKKRKRASHEKIAPDVSAATDGVENSSGAAALSSLVTSLKTKVAKRNSR